MRRFFLLTTFLVMSSGLVFAQLTEDFETGSVNYFGSVGLADLSSGNWQFANASLGASPEDKKEGKRSARLDSRDGKTAQIRMINSKDGVSVVRFYYANYGSDTDGVVQLSYSEDDGDTFVDAGEPFLASDELQMAQVILDLDEEIQIRFTATGGARVNIDNVVISDYIIAEEEPTMDVFVDGELFPNSDSFTFDAIQTGEESSVSIAIRNRGNQTLVIDSAFIEGQGFVFESIGETELGFLETKVLFLDFIPEEGGTYQASLQIMSNAVNSASYEIDFSGQAVDEGEVLPISLARKQDIGIRVTVAGRVTVSDQFDGPMVIEDKTAAIAVYWPPLHNNVGIGDSVVVTGPLTVFNPTTEPDEGFVLQIADDVSFEIFSENPREVAPTLITAEEMNAGGFESQLVLIQNVEINDSGVFQGEANYDFSSASGNGEIRIDGDAEDIVGALIPEGEINIVGIVDQFNGVYQLKPRFVQDLGVEEVIYPGENISKDFTFEVVTWNVEWFGNTSNGPENEELQLQNIQTVINTIDADIYALQEVSSSFRFTQLVNELDAYGGVLAGFSQTQKTAFLFKRSSIDSLDSGLITTGMDDYDWASGRFPLSFHFNATINGETQEVYAYNIHAKAFGDEESYSRKVDASAQMKAYLDTYRETDNVIFLGDYNDEMNSSITTGEESPYKNFVDDIEYTVISKFLEDKGFSSQSSGSMLDHIIISSELADEYFEETERIENTSYIGSYLSTTSDHFPVWTRFQFGDPVSNEGETELPDQISLEQNYPNPFNPTTTISYSLDKATKVKLQVFDMMGRKVATLINGSQPAGNQQVIFDASQLASGVYLYRLSTAEGQHLTQKMLLLK